MKKAMMKIKASLTNNVGIKIVAVIIAALIWLTVINVSDPEKTIVIYNVPIMVTHKEAITEMGMVYEVASKNTVNITISGKRSVVGKLSADDFKATASLKELSKVNSVPIEVSVRSNSIARRITIVEQSSQTMMLNVEEIQKNEFNIEVQYSGSAATGYVPGEYTLSKNTVRISAPTSVLDRIHKVVAECNLDGTREDISEKCKLVLYDKHGKEIKDKNITMSATSVTVNVTVLKEREIPVTLEELGEPAGGYQVESVSFSQEKIKVSGDESTIGALKKIDISKEIDISKQKKDYVKEVDLAGYIPEGVAVHGDTVIRVEVRIKRLATKTIAIKTADIKVKNLKEDLECTIDEKNIDITLRGKSDMIESISSKDLEATIDLGKYKTGKATVPVKIKIPQGTEIVKEVTVKVKLNKK